MAQEKIRGVEILDDEQLESSTLRSLQAISSEIISIVNGAELQLQANQSLESEGDLDKLASYSLRVGRIVEKKLRPFNDSLQKPASFWRKLFFKK